MILNTHTQLVDFDRCAQHSQNSTQHKSYALQDEHCSKLTKQLAHLIKEKSSEWERKIYARFRKLCSLKRQPHWRVMNFVWSFAMCECDVFCQFARIYQYFFVWHIVSLDVKYTNQWALFLFRFVCVHLCACIFRGKLRISLSDKNISKKITPKLQSKMNTFSTKLGNTNAIYVSILLHCAEVF